MLPENFPNLGALKCHFLRFPYICRRKKEEKKVLLL